MVKSLGSPEALGAESPVVQKSFVHIAPINLSEIKRYHTNSMYWDRKVSANSADQDQTASEEAV